MNEIFLIESSMFYFLYTHTVYVKYDDITAEDFLHVQMDIDYRREWDRMFMLILINLFLHLLIK